MEYRRCSDHRGREDQETYPLAQLRSIAGASDSPPPLRHLVAALRRAVLSRSSGTRPRCRYTERERREHTARLFGNGRGAWFRPSSPLPAPNVIDQSRRSEAAKVDAFVNITERSQRLERIAKLTVHR